MSGLNKVMIIGHLGADPEARSFQNGGEVVNLRIATSESWKDRASGERKERTEWHQVAVLSEPLGKVAKQYLRKGSKVYIEGQLRTRKWQHQDGSDRWSTEIVLGAFGAALQLLDKREGDSGRGDYSSYRETPGGSGAPATGGFADDLDDDVPF